MNDAMTLSQRADALEQRMSDELEYIVIKSRLYSLADADMSPPPNAGALMAKNPKLRVLMGDDPRLPAMPERPTLIDLFRYRFGPAAHVLQSARHAVNAGLPEKMVLACLLHDISTMGFIRGDRPSLPPAERGLGLRQQPRRAYVACDATAGEIPLGPRKQRAKKKRAASCRPSPS